MKCSENFVITPADCW